MPDEPLTLRERYDQIIARLDEPKMGNPKYGMDRRSIESELRSVALDAIEAAALPPVAPDRPDERLRARIEALPYEFPEGRYRASVLAACADDDVSGGIHPDGDFDGLYIEESAE